MKPAARKTLLALLFVACLVCIGFALNAIFVGSMNFLCQEVFAYMRVEGSLLAQKKFKEGAKDKALGLLAALRELHAMERGYCRGHLAKHPHQVIAGGVAAALGADWSRINEEGMARELDVLERVFKHGTPQDLELTPEKVRAIERALAASQ